VNHLSSDFVTQKPECLDAKDSLDLMMVLAQDDVVATLTDLLSITSMAEREYMRLSSFRVDQRRKTQ